MKVYNKLVRDKIPNIINESGKICDIRILNEVEYIKELKKKVVEEAIELEQTKDKKELIEEIADIYEVLEALLNAEKIDSKNILKIRNEKNNIKGKFKQHIFLERVE